MKERLQKFLNTRPKSCLHFFDSVNEQSDKETQDYIPKYHTNDSGFDETSSLSSLDKQHHYVATSQDGLPVSQIIMRMFDNDDIEGIIPPRFLEAEYPGAIMDNIRKE